MFNQSIRSADYLLFVAIFARLKGASATDKGKAKRLLFVSLFIVFHLMILSFLSFAFLSCGASTQVTIIEVQVPNTCWVGQPLEISVTAKVAGNDSPMGSITLSFSKPVDIQFVKEDVRVGVSKKVYPIGSKVWNQQKNASMASIRQIVELFVEAWPKGQAERLSILVIPKEVGELEIYFRATVKDAKTGKFVNALTQGMLDQQGYPCDKRIVQVREFFPQVWDEQKLPPAEIINKTLHDINKDGIDDLILAATPQAATPRDRPDVQLAIYAGKNGTYIKSWSTFLTTEIEGIELMWPQELKIEFLDCNKDGQEEMIVELVLLFAVGATSGHTGKTVAFYYSAGLQKQKLLDIPLKDDQGPIPVPEFGRTISSIHSFSREIQYSDIDGDSDEDIVVECYKRDLVEDVRWKLYRRETYLWQDGKYLFDKKNLNSQVQELLNKAKTMEDDNVAIELLDNIQDEYYSIEPQAEPSLQLEAYYIAAQRYLSSKKYEPAYKSLKTILSSETSSPQAFLLKNKALYEIGKLYEEQFHDYDAAFSVYSGLAGRHYREEEIRKRLEHLEQRKKGVRYTPLSKENLGKVEPRFIKVIKEEVLKGLLPAEEAWWTDDRLEDNQEEMLSDFGSVEDYLPSPDGKLIAFITSSGGRTWRYDLNIAQVGENGFEVTDIAGAAKNGEIEVEMPEMEEGGSGDWITLLGWRNGHQLIFGVGLEGELPYTLKFALYDAEAKVVKSILPGQIGPGRYSQLISPDGSKLAYLDAETGAIWIKNSDGSQSSILNYEVKQEYYDVLYLRWSPDGSKLMFFDKGQIVLLTLATLAP